jgi:dolichyl-phosphate beta-glucosyltransferase
MDLSIIIPAYNAENFIDNTINKLISSFPESEIIIINDGSQDRTLDKINNYSNIKVINHTENLGKGKSLQDGFKLTSKKFIIFTDADLPYGIDNIKKVYDKLENNACDIVVGYRTKFKESFFRHLTHIGINVIIQFLFWFNIYDTQCGLKGFKKGFIDKIQSKLISKNFTIDIEFLYLAKILKQNVCKLIVDTNYDKKSSTIKIKDIIIMLIEIFKIRFNKNYFKK